MNHQERNQAAVAIAQKHPGLVADFATESEALRARLGEWRVIGVPPAITTDDDGSGMDGAPCETEASPTARR